ncbi:fat storage-inducing transmembrane protein 1 [Clarias magur]|uniref:Fat storage-inducing transmembrane protein 1 n=1 Tax=Clarias magur TaxID=1594786 RepID=A0A8J4X8X5_CLAMG|nr:fat storage-inducing transmembrane protein 1 [Clarias magur]
MVLFGPLLNLWVSHYSVFAKRSHYLYRVFLRSGWGWTCIFVGSFVFLLSLSVRRSLTLTLRHLSRLAVAGGLWLGFRKLLSVLENATGSCYERLPGSQELAVGSEAQPLLLLREALGWCSGLPELEGNVPGLVPFGTKLVLPWKAWDDLVTDEEATKEIRLGHCKHF